MLALCLDDSWFARFGSCIIQPQYFETEAEQRVCKTILKFYEKYKHAPCRDELEASVTLLSATKKKDKEVAESENAEVIEAVFGHHESSDLKFAEDMALQFAREQAMKIAILESMDDIEQDNLSRPLERIKVAQCVGNDLTELGLVLKEDLSWVYYESDAEKIHTGIHHLDIGLEGGLGRGELGVVMAATNVGKTQLLINIGCGAAGIMSKANVVHVTCEISAKKVAKRYGARTVFRWVKQDDDPDHYVMDFHDKASMLMPGNVYIKEWPAGVATVDDIDNYLERLTMSGIVPDLLVVDHPDEMKHSSVGEYRQNIAETFRGLRRIAQRRNIPVWGATQAGRQALSKELVTVADIAESYEKAAVSDVIVAICQTMEEKEEGIVRLFAAKIRDGNSGWMIRCHIADEAHAVVSDGMMKVSELSSERRKRAKAAEE